MKNLAPPKSDDPVAWERYRAHLATIPVQTADVIAWASRVHIKKGSPNSVRITYASAERPYPEWILVEHPGPGRYRAEKWWAAHGGLAPVPATADEAVSRWDEVRMPLQLNIRPNGKWFDIVGRSFEAAEVAA